MCLEISYAMSRMFDQAPWCGLDVHLIKSPGRGHGYYFWIMSVATLRHRHRSHRQANAHLWFREAGLSYWSGGHF